MQQDFMPSGSGEQSACLVWCYTSGLHKLGWRSTHNVRFHTVETDSQSQYWLTKPCFKLAFSNSDTQVGSCIAMIKDYTSSFGDWRSHVCRYERPYMCKRPLNSKTDCFGNTRFTIVKAFYLVSVFISHYFRLLFSLLTCSHLPCWLAELWWQLLLDGQ